jgi:hypothetical protein
MFWLPPNGFGNSIGAQAWAELADLPEGEVASVLFTLAEAGIGGYVAVPRALRDRSRVMYRLWVDSPQYRHAEDILMELLATLHGRRPPRPH